MCDRLEDLSKMRRIEPTHFVIGRPQFTGLVDINLAGLLSVGLSELLVDSQSVQASLEDTSFAAEIGCAAKTKGGCKVEFGFVEQVTVGIVGEIEQIVARPVGFERLGIVLWQGGCGRSIVWKRFVVGIFRTFCAWCSWLRRG